MSNQSDNVVLVGDAARAKQINGVKAEPGLYVATRHPMFNSETGQHFTLAVPLKVTADQLDTTWFKMQLQAGNLRPMEDDTKVTIPVIDKPTMIDAAPAPSKAKPAAKSTKKG